jgi:endo-1,3-1,4-beta-glycanase ExoK
LLPGITNGLTVEGPLWSFTTSTILSPPTPYPEPTPTPDPAPELKTSPKIKLGDITGDGKIDVEDVTLVKQYVLGLKLFTNDQKEAADVNGDKKINVIDVVLIMKKALGLIDKFPTE